MRIIWVILFLSFSTPASSQAENPAKSLKIKLVSGVVLYPESLKVIDEGKETCHLVINDMDKLAIGLVSYFQTENDFFLVKDIGHWGKVILRKVVDGKIQVFNFSGKIFNPYYDGGDDRKSFNFYIFDNELRPLTKKNIRLDLGSDPYISGQLKIMKKDELTQAMLFSGGIILSTYGLGQMYQTQNSITGSKQFDFSPNPPFLLGLAGIFGGVYLNKRRISLLDLVTTYNQRQIE